jgi:hypothetical protein
MTVTKNGARLIQIVNVVFAVVGAVIAAGGLYIFFVDWGPTDRAFIDYTCAFIILFGGTGFLTAYLGTNPFE